MKIDIFENDFVFGFDLFAENLKEAAWIIRFQRNVKKETPMYGGYAEKEGEFHQWFTFKRKVEKISFI